MPSESSPLLVDRNRLVLMSRDELISLAMEVVVSLERRTAGEECNAPGFLLDVYRTLLRWDLGAVHEREAE